MQLKIISERGQCRGRPPTRFTNRDGPGDLEFLIPSARWRTKFQIMKSSVSLSDLSALVVLRLWGEKPDLLLSKRRWGEEERVASLQSSVISQVNRKFTVDRRSARGGRRSAPPPTADRKYLAPKARDWPDITCSLRTYIAQNRLKHRLITKLKNAGNRQDGRGMPGGGGIGLGDWEIGRLGDWRIGGLEDWGIGRLDSGTLEQWNSGTVEQWNSGTVEQWNNGTTEQCSRKRYTI